MLSVDSRNAAIQRALLLSYAKGPSSMIGQPLPIPPSQPPIAQEPADRPFPSQTYPVQSPLTTQNSAPVPNPLAGMQSVTINQKTAVQVPVSFSYQTPAQQPFIQSSAPSGGPKLTTTQRLQTALLQNRPTQKNGKHLVLDLDETLVHTFDTKDGYTDFAEDLTDEQKQRVYTLKFPGGEVLQGFVRPYAEDFLRVAFEEFDTVGVWSAGTSYYVNLIVGIVFKDRQPAYVMSRDQCNELVLKKEPLPCRYKPLEVIYHKYPDHNEANTVIVDDRHDICSLNCMNNIRIPEFLMNISTYGTLTNDSTLLVLAEWFQSPEFRAARDVRAIKGRSPFKI